MLERVVIENFRTIRHVDWQPRALNILVGTNNAGKTNVCRALAFLARASQYQDLDAAARDTCGAPTEIVARDATSDTVHFGLQVLMPPPQEPDCRLRYDVVIRARPPGRDGRPMLTVESEALTRIDRPEPKLLEREGVSAHVLDEWEANTRPEAAPKRVEFELPATQTVLSTLLGAQVAAAGGVLLCRSAIGFRTYLRAFRYYNIDATGVRGQEPSRSDFDLATRGSNLFAVLSAMEREDRPTYDRVLEAVSRIEPRLRRLRFVPLADGSVVAEVELEGVQHPVSLSAMSDGTLRYLALVTAALQQATDAPAVERPTLVMFEEPENGLYVRHQGELVRVLTELPAHTQTIVTTHNPFLLDYFDDRIEDIVVVSRDSDEVGTMLRTPNREAVERMLEHMSPGEMLFREVLACE